MTREEEKREAARKYATHDVDTHETDFYGNYVKKEDFVLPEFNAFLAGCKWSDENPKCPWISVKDDLPCNHKELLNKDDSRYTVPVLIRRHNVTNGEIRYVETVMTIYCSKEWIWMDVNAKQKVTHWMPIPELPKMK